MTFTAQEWLEALAERLGVDAPSPEETDALLGVAGVSAHVAERVAAPLSTWLIGRSGIEPRLARDVVDQLAASLGDDSWRPA